MKRFLSIALILVTLFCLASCSGNIFGKESSERDVVEIEGAAGAITLDEATIKELLSYYQSTTIIDTILCLDGTEVIGACLAANLCLVAPTPYLALGLAGVEMKDNLKFCFLPTWALSIVLAIVAALTGAFPF